MYAINVRPFISVKIRPREQSLLEKFQLFNNWHASRTNDWMIVSFLKKLFMYGKKIDMDHEIRMNTSDLWKVDCHGNTLLILACQYNYESLARAILNTGYNCNIFIENNQGQSALVHAVKNGMDVVYNQILGYHKIMISDKVKRYIAEGRKSNAMIKYALPHGLSSSYPANKN
jgi:hypothetical protein